MSKKKVYASLEIADQEVRLVVLEVFDGRYNVLRTEKAACTGIKNQKVVLGLITSKNPKLEDKAAVIARIHEAEQYVPLEQLSVSPQCGFASTEEGNLLTEEEQWAKVRLVAEIAREVWKD